MWLLKFNIVVCCVLLFSIFEAPVHAPRARQMTKLIGESHLDSVISWLLCLLHKQLQGVQICVVIYYLALSRSMIIAIKQISLVGTPALTSYISLLNQAGKVRSSRFSR